MIAVLRRKAHDASCMMPLAWPRMQDKNNNKIGWGDVPYADIFGEHGWYED